jgi:cellulose synthase/poly-beta-1,6-N-acetylglucosamine synthase-like glycosyltransferase
MFSGLDNIIYFITQLIQIIIFLGGSYYFSISIFGWFKKKEGSNQLNIPEKRFALVVAAHNEEPVIANVIDSLKQQSYPQDLYDIFVIADNCTDNTADIARKNGAFVYERFNNLQRGKGYALDWMFKKLFNIYDKYDAVAVFDADNLVSANFLREMNKQLRNGHKIIQGYIDSKNPFDSWITLSYSIAFWLSNQLFQTPRYYLGLSCGLCGTGFAIDIQVLREIGWGATCLTEDLEFTMKLAIHGMKVAWAQNAVVYDEKPLTLKQSWNQRKRWMQGHADCARRFLPLLFSKAFKEGDFIAFDCAIYLFQPIRYIFIGLINVMLWIQTLYPESPFYNLKYVFPVDIWYVFVLFQFIYGPAVMIASKRFHMKTLLGFIVYPIYCLTWVPITIQGILSRNNKVWCHTRHTRDITIEELE